MRISRENIMPDQLKESKDIQQSNRIKAEQEEILARDQARKAVFLAKEQQIAKVQDARENQRSEARVKEESRQAAREKARRETYLAHEKAISDAHEARKLKENK
jgi:hypothetical protein